MRNEVASIDRFSLSHSWASVSMLTPLSSALQYPTSQSCTGAFRYRNGSPYCCTGLVPASAFFFVPLPDWRVPDSQAFTKTVRRCKGVHLQFHSVGRGQDTGIHPARPYTDTLMGVVLNLLCPALAFQPVISCVSPASDSGIRASPVLRVTD